MKCTKCGAMNLPEAKFCSACGSAIVVQKPTSVTCYMCGTTNEPNAQFCIKCGNNLQNMQSVNTTGSAKIILKPGSIHTPYTPKPIPTPAPRPMPKPKPKIKGLKSARIWRNTMMVFSVLFGICLLYFTLSFFVYNNSYYYNYYRIKDLLEIITGASYNQDYYEAKTAAISNYKLNLLICELVSGVLTAICLTLTIVNNKKIKRLRRRNV